MKSHCFKFIPTLKFLTLSNWHTLKIYYSLTGPKIEILNTFSLLVANYLMLFPVS